MICTYILIYITWFINFKDDGIIIVFTYANKWDEVYVYTKKCETSLL